MENQKIKGQHQHHNLVRSLQVAQNNAQANLPDQLSNRILCSEENQTKPNQNFELLFLLNTPTRVIAPSVPCGLLRQSQ